MFEPGVQPEATEAGERRFQLQQPIEYSRGDLETQTYSVRFLFCVARATCYARILPSRTFIAPNHTLRIPHHTHITSHHTRIIPHHTHTVPRPHLVAKAALVCEKELQTAVGKVLLGERAAKGLAEHVWLSPWLALHAHAAAAHTQSGRCGFGAFENLLGTLLRRGSISVLPDTW